MTAAPLPLEVPPWTERALLDRLRARHSQHVGNGPVWSFMEHAGWGLLVPRGMVAAMLRANVRTRP